jgi:hypothetical protein
MRRCVALLFVKVSAQQDGTFTVTNDRNGFVKTYRAQSGT